MFGQPRDVRDRNDHPSRPSRRLCRSEADAQLHTRRSVVRLDPEEQETNVGTATTTTHAPSVNLEMRNTSVASAVTTAPMPLTARADVPPGRSGPPPVDDQSGLGQGESGEHADGEERDHLVGVPAHGDQKSADKPPAPDAVGEDLPVSAQREEMGQVVVPGQQAGQDRQPAERGVGGQGQHDGDGERDDVVGPMPSDGHRHDLAEDRLVRSRTDVPSLGPARPGPGAWRRGSPRATARSAWPAPPGAAGTAGTPLAIASTPVSALQPAENAFNTSSTLTACSPWVGSSEWPGWAARRPRGWTSPMAMMASRPTMNIMVGRRKARAVSPSPRRLSTVITARMPRQSGTVADDRLGNAEVSAPTPAAMDTATVSV